VVVALLALQGCTKTVYYAVLAPHDAMADQSGCHRQCQMIHAAQTKEFLACAESCPGTRVFTEKKCNEIEFDAGVYACTTMHNQKLDGAALGLGIVLVVLLNVVLVAITVSNSNKSVP
jgi:hypothetical protein